MTVDNEGNQGNMELFDAGSGKGRGLRASRELAAGDVIFTEASFAAVVLDSLATKVCHSCFRYQVGLHRCAQCKFAHYCDRTCQTACWDEHKRECGAIRKVGHAPSTNVRLAARVLWRLHKDTGVVADSQLVSVEQLEDHVSQLNQQELQKLKTDVDHLQAFWSYGSKLHSVDYMLHIFGIIRCNGFTLSDQRGLQAVGVGLFPNLCLVNHDCWPNCTVVLNHGNQSALSSALHSQKRIELRALETIPEGEELSVSYVDFLDVSADRQKKLKEHFHFECSCQLCSQRVKDDLMTAAAEGHTVSESTLRDVSAFSKESLEKIDQCRVEGDVQQVVKLCRECLQKQDGVLADTHLYRLRVLSVASEALSYLQRFSEAADHAHKMVEGYLKLYHHNNPQLGLALMRAGVTQWHAGQVEQGHALICQAYRIVLLSHGPHHAISRDLEAMRTQLELELKMLKETVEGS